MTMAFRYSRPRFVVGMIRARGSFNRMADHAARADAESLTHEDLIASLQDNANHPWKPAGRRTCCSPSAGAGFRRGDCTALRRDRFSRTG